VGAGPAGATAARELARRGVAALLVDRAAFPRWKICGCCLNLRSLAALASVGLGDLPERCRGRRLEAVRLAAQGCAVRLPLPGGAALSREALDTALVREAVAAGAHFLPSTHASLGPVTPEGREVRLRRSEETLTLAAEVLLAADGLGGLLGTARAEPASRIGAGVVATDGPAFYQPGVIYLACGAGGYVGLVRLEDDRLDVAAALDVRAVRRKHNPGRAAVSILKEAGLPPVPDLDELPWRGTPPLTRRPVCVAGERVLAIGDAAGYVEPFTGEGIAWALTAALAVAPLAARPWDASTAGEWERAYKQTVARRQWAALVAARLLRHPDLVRLIVSVLDWFPNLARPVLSSLNAP